MKRRVFVLFSLFGAACASAPPIDVQETIVPLAQGGKLTILSPKDAPLPGWRQSLIDQTWQRFCTLDAHYQCDLSETYNLTMFGSSAQDCAAIVNGDMLPKAGGAKMGLDARFDCVAGTDGLLLVKNASLYRPEDGPPVVYFDEIKPKDIQVEDAPIPVEVVTKSDKR